MGSQRLVGLLRPQPRIRVAAAPLEVALPPDAVSAFDRIRLDYREIVLMDLFERLQNGGVEKFCEKLGSYVFWNASNSIRIPWYLMTPRREAG